MNKSNTVRQWSVWKNINVWFGATAIFGVLSSAHPTHAQSKEPVVITLTAQKVLPGSDGREILKAADRATPGEVIQYDALYRNQGQQNIRELEPTLPIPSGLEYLPDTAKPAPTKASLDGKTFATIPLMRQVTLPGGRVIERPVPHTEYRALRWSVGDLQAGGSATVSARAKLVAN